jgi:hypothetical protein
MGFEETGLELFAKCEQQETRTRWKLPKSARLTPKPLPKEVFSLFLHHPSVCIMSLRVADPL